MSQEPDFKIPSSSSAATYSGKHWCQTTIVLINYRRGGPNIISLVEIMIKEPSKQNPSVKMRVGGAKNYVLMLRNTSIVAPTP